MLEVEIPGFRRLALQHAVFDVNGTLALDGQLLPGVAARLEQLSGFLTVHLLTADTFGRQAEIDAILALEGVVLQRGESEAEQKAAYVNGLGAQSVVAIGNGANDVLMLRSAALSLAILGPEGVAGAALSEAVIVVTSIEQALDLLLNPRRMVATLRR